MPKLAKTSTISGPETVVEKKAGLNNLSSVARIVAAIYDGIRHGRYSPGQRLPEPELSRQFGISKPVLREAFARLQAEGVLDIRPHKGATLRRLTKQSLMHLLEICSVLEGLSARYAAAAMHDPDVRKDFDLAMDSFWQTEVSSMVQWWDAALKFQEIIHRAGPNPELERLSGVAHSPFLRPMVAYLPLVSAIVEEFWILAKDVADTIRACDRNGAEAAMRNMILKNTKIFVDNVE